MFKTEVKMPDNSIYTVKTLLGKPDSNVKLAKSQIYRYRTVGLSLASGNISGHEVCSHRSKGCFQHCIVHSGHAQIFPAVMTARIAKARFFFQNRHKFLLQLRYEIHNQWKLARLAKRKLAVRTNVYADLKWEKICPEMFFEFPSVQYYDYTKIPSRMLTPDYFPPNYHLTFSRSEDNWADCKRVLEAGKNVAVVFKGKFPRKFEGWDCINGDRHDLRFLDPSPKIVALRAKGSGRKDTTGFVVHV